MALKRQTRVWAWLSIPSSQLEVTCLFPLLEILEREPEVEERKGRKCSRVLKSVKGRLRPGRGPGMVVKSDKSQLIRGLHALKGQPQNVP